MDIWELDKLKVFIAFVIPGFISVKTYDLLVPSELKNSSEQIIEAITYSCINYAFLSWAIYFVEINKWGINHRIGYALFYFIVLFASPVLLAFAWNKLRYTQLFQASTHHPIGKPWDYIFRQHKWYWVIVNLKNGSKIGGLYGGESFTSSAPEKEQIYLQESWLLNADGGFERPRQKTAGIIIISDEISSVELFLYETQGGQNNERSETA